MGWHLVWVDSITSGRVPAFEEVEAQAKDEWIALERNTVLTTWKAFVVALLLVLTLVAYALPVEFWGAPALESVSTVSGETAIP